MVFELLCKGDYSQGSTKFSAESRGKQCVSMCFTFLLKSLIVDVNKWTKQELHNVLNSGDVLYKDIRTKSSVHSDYEYLHPMELPENISLKETDQKQIRSKLLQTFSGVCSENYVGDFPYSSLENAILSSYSGVGVGHLILIIQGTAVGIFHDGSKFYIFDSHARDEYGLLNSTGTCILGYCSSLHALCAHIRAIVGSICSLPLEEVQYDLHSFNLKVIANSQKKKRSLVKKNLVISESSVQTDTSASTSSIQSDMSNSR